mmetsp:Transcript_51598/g.92943  ORF Transcript_51598/g.92943 Transcript_51598/m.92943 type:complete len:105 (+) Transcript_51598:198-512(+)
MLPVCGSSARHAAGFCLEDDLLPMDVSPLPKRMFQTAPPVMAASYAGTRPPAASLGNVSSAATGAGHPGTLQTKVKSGNMSLMKRAKTAMVRLGCSTPTPRSEQ